MKDIKNVIKHIERVISKFFNHNRIPFNTHDNPYYESMVDLIADVDPGVKPPITYDISNTYLDLKVETRQYIATYGSYWNEFECKLICEGSTTQNGRNNINFLVIVLLAWLSSSSQIQQMIQIT